MRSRNASNLQEVICENHQEPITNYCLSTFSPLCPDCIRDHYKKSSSQPFEVESLKNVKQNCSKKLKAGITALQNEMKTKEMQYYSDPDAEVQRGMREIEKCQRELMSTISVFFDQIREEYRTKVHQNVIQSTDFQDIFDSIRNMVKQLDQLDSDLETVHMIKTIETILLLDLKSLMDRFRSAVHKVIDSKDLDPIVVSIDTHRMGNLKDELERIIQITKGASDYHTREFDSNDGNQNVIVATNQNTPFQNSGNNFVPASTQNFKNTGGLGSTKNFQFASSGALLSINNISINILDWFEEDCKRKILPFFVSQAENVNRLLFVNLTPTYLNNNKHLRFQSVLCDNAIPIPLFHQSIIMPNGEVYLIGGRQNDVEKSSEIYRFNFLTQKLELVGHMKIPRSSHGVCILRNYIYIIGGFTNNHQMTASCERFDVLTRKVEIVESLNYAASSLGCASFNSQYIFKFGGFGENNQLSQYIERYDIITNKWIIIDPKIGANENPSGFALHTTTACCQINAHDIIIMGGYNQANQGSKLTYVFTPDINDLDNNIIKCINWKPIPYGEGFWNSQAIVCNNYMYVLQNVAIQNSNNCIPESRNILQFSGRQWKNLTAQ